jgi:hypothetical protein
VKDKEKDDKEKDDKEKKEREEKEKKEREEKETKEREEKEKKDREEKEKKDREEKEKKDREEKDKKDKLEELVQKKKASSIILHTFATSANIHRRTFSARPSRSATKPCTTAHCSCLAENTTSPHPSQPWSMVMLTFESLAQHT